MQLKIKRSQRDGGLIGNTAIFCLDARVEFTPAEQQSIIRYKLQGQVIYNSEASKKHLDQGDRHRDGSAAGGLKSIAHYVAAALNLNITIAGLQRGQHIECKSLDELLGAEDAVMVACQNLNKYLETAATFDGREVLVDFADGTPELIAASSPQPALIAPSPASVAGDASPEPEETAGLPPPMPPFPDAGPEPASPGGPYRRESSAGDAPSITIGDFDFRAYAYDYFGTDDLGRIVFTVLIFVLVCLFFGWISHLPAVLFMILGGLGWAAYKKST